MYFQNISRKLLTSFLLFAPCLAYADDDLSSRIFYSYESNGADYISSIGAGTTFKNLESNLGFQLNMSIGNANVLATDGYLEEFTVWQGSAKFGYFSNFSVYIEGGIDLSEAIFHDIRYDDYDHQTGYEDDIDAFVGMGAGIRAGALGIDAFFRVREIDAEYWEAESEVFSGVQISVNF